MLKKFYLSYPATLALALILATSSCAKAQSAGLTDAQVSGAAENILQAINANDYQQFTQDFSDTMKNAFTQEQFTQLRDQLQAASGNYVSIGAPILVNSQGYAVYRFPCKFEKESVIVTVTFAIGGNQVEGLFFDSTNLRAVSQ